MMCLGDNNQPSYVNYYKRIMDKEFSLHYTDIFNPINSKEFLQGVYSNHYSDFVNSIHNQYPMIYYTTGYFINDGLEKVVKFQHNENLKNRKWDDRILLHREIANHAKGKKYE